MIATFSSTMRHTKPRNEANTAKPANRVDLLQYVIIVHSSYFPTTRERQSPHTSTLSSTLSGSDGGEAKAMQKTIDKQNTPVHQSVGEYRTPECNRPTPIRHYSTLELYFPTNNAPQTIATPPYALVNALRYSDAEEAKAKKKNSANKILI